MPTRAQRAAEARRLRHLGLKQREIAETMGIGRSYAAELLDDPAGQKARVRRESYAGVCENCGSPTTGGDGPAKAPRFCVHCAPGQNRQWTEETVVAAIREWARRHGRPPSSTDWLHYSVAEDGYKFPNRGSCYRSTSGSTAPFESWADAIEAAGFPRPRKGQRTKGKSMPSKHTRPYLVFRRNGSGSLDQIGETVAVSNQEAVESLASEPGKYASVAVGSLQEFDLRPKLVASRTES